jgi:hypothetical protein
MTVSFWVKLVSQCGCHNMGVTMWAYCVSQILDYKDVFASVELVESGY